MAHATPHDAINQYGQRPGPGIPAKGIDELKAGAGDHQTTDGGKDHQEYTQKAALHGVAGHLDHQGVVGHRYSGVEDRVADIIGNEHEQVFQCVRCFLRYHEYDDAGDREGNAASQQPAASLAELGILALVDNVSHDQVGNAVKQTGNQHDSTDYTGAQTNDVCVVEGQERHDGDEHECIGEILPIP